MPNLFIESQGRVVVLVHNGLPYTPEEWQTILALTARTDLADLRILVHDDEGSSLNTAQRREVLDTMGGRMPMAAVLTSGRMVRGVVTALAWFKPGIKAFAPEHLDKAVAYLGLTEKEAAFATGAVPRLRGQLQRKAS